MPRRLLRKVKALAGPSSAPPADREPQPKASAPSPLDDAQNLVNEGRFDDAIALLQKLNERSQSLQVEHRIVNARREGALALERNELPEVWPPLYADPFPDVNGQIPEVEAAELTTEIMGGGIVNHGALLVRGLIDAASCQRAREGIDQALEDHAASRKSKKYTRWFHPLAVPERVEDNGVMRGFVAGQGGIWLNDSPAAAEFVLGLLHQTPVIRSIEEFLGERPVVSLQKSTLRRSEPEYRVVSWHQDGAFLDPNIRTVNVWIAMSPCGGDLPTPGLELAPRRVDHIIEPDGGELAANSLSGWAVHDLLEGTPTVIPEFAPGDAIIFDERFVHRTHLTPEMTERRYALENWFFAPSSADGGYDMLLA